MKRFLPVLVGVIVAAALAPVASTKAPDRVSVLPVFFVPTDTAKTVAKDDLATHWDLLDQHLAAARKKYKDVLQTDTFAEADGHLIVYGTKSSSEYDSIPERKDSDAVHVITSEILRKNRDSRTDSRTVYLTLFVRPGYATPASSKRQFGGGRTFNGPPGSGGGVVVVEFSSLVRDKPYPFQSTLVHELGHAFGLTHCDCFGYSMDSNNSLMSYNPRHHTMGLQPPPQSGTFNPEEFYELSLNTLAFPGFVFKPAVHNPRGRELRNVDECFLGPMSTVIGDYRRIPAKGYELFFNGRLVSGPEAAYYTRGQAQKNCKANLQRHDGDGVRVECRYDGRRF